MTKKILGVIGISAILLTSLACVDTPNPWPPDSYQSNYGVFSRDKRDFVANCVKHMFKDYMRHYAGGGINSSRAATYADIICTDELRQMESEDKENRYVPVH